MSYPSLEYTSVSQLHMEQHSWHQHCAVYTHIHSPRGDQCALKQLILVSYQMLMLSEMFAEVLCSSSIYSALQHRKLLGETFKGFGIQTGPSLESTWERAEVRNGLSSFIDGISKPLDHIQKH